MKHLKTKLWKLKLGSKWVFQSDIDPQHPQDNEVKILDLKRNENEVAYKPDPVPPVCETPEEGHPKSLIHVLQFSRKWSSFLLHNSSLMRVETADALCSMSSSRRNLSEQEVEGRRASEREINPKLP